MSIGDRPTPYGMRAMAAFSLPGPRHPRHGAPRRRAAPTPAPAFLAGIDAVLDPTGALYWAAEGTLVVSDLHLETGSAFARSGQMVPPYDTGLTLARLAEAMGRYRPMRVISLGDSFHDRRGAERLAGADLKTLLALTDRAEFVWVTGNHEGDSVRALPGSVHDVYRLGGVTFRHIPAEGLTGEPEVAGHLHPAAWVTVRGRRLRRRCFLGCAERLVMPAFGCLTGGLSVADAAFAALWPEPPGPRPHVLGQERVYAL
ncbi:ligase-associated DNA damage response endonuclease PdeM [Acuticoccus kandeliae]|uniref:ligase-associated DNA damage response endonuclease PdeM n=1 Tax=Acuticoccus kandeliae TaxID=2073160 RepID=UPI00196A4A18|nr:ligase-associated DNA damage response endonuclease PdeM [Acuticoccus kandeliae]